MNLDDELRDALNAEADASRPVPNGWGRLQDRLGHTSRRSHRWLLPVTAAAVLSLAAVGAWQLTRDGGVTVGVGGENPTTTLTTTTATTSRAPTTAASPRTTTSPTATAAPPTSLPTTPTSAVPPAPPTTIVAVTLDGRVVALDAVTGAELRELANLGDPRVAVPEGPGPNFVTQVSVTPDGSTAYYDTCCEPAVGTIFSVPTDGSRPPSPLVNGLGPAVSPNGRYLAYTAVNALVVRDLATGDERTFTDPSYDPSPLFGDVAWSRDGTKVYYPWHRLGPGGFTWSLVEVDVAAGTPPRPFAEADAALEDPLALDDGQRVSVLAHSIRPDGRPGPNDGVLTVTPGALAPGQTTVPGRDTATLGPLADWNYDSRNSALLVVTEEGHLVSGDRTLGTGYTVADW